MPRFAVLDSVSHADLRVKVQYGAAFGNSINQALVFPTEFQALQREYPIFFRQADDQTFYAVVLTGLDKDENLYLEGDHWNARYVPALQMAGPFALEIKEARGGHAAEPDPIVRVNLDDPRTSESEGHNVFLPHGGYTPYFEEILMCLRRVHVGATVSKEFFSQLSSFGLIEAVAVQATFSDALSYSVPDVFTISREKMASLTGEQLHQLNQLGLLEHCFAVMSSADNVSRLVHMKALRDSVSV